MPHLKPRSFALPLALAPALAAAHGIGLAEVSFVAEIAAILAGLVVFSVGETTARSVWLNLAFICLVVVAWIISFGVAGSIGAGASAASETVPVTLGAALLVAGTATWRLKRSQWRRKAGADAA